MNFDDSFTFAKRNHITVILGQKLTARHECQIRKHRRIIDAIKKTITFIGGYYATSSCCWGGDV